MHDLICESTFWDTIPCSNHIRNDFFYGKTAEEMGVGREAKEEGMFFWISCDLLWLCQNDLAKKACYWSICNTNCYLYCGCTCNVIYRALSHDFNQELGRIQVWADLALSPPPLVTAKSCKFSLFGGYISQFWHSVPSFCKSWIRPWRVVEVQHMSCYPICYATRQRVVGSIV